MRRGLLYFIIFLLIIFINGCLPLTPPTIDEFIEINNSGSIELKNEHINLDSAMMTKSTTGAFEYSITYLARIMPVIITDNDKNNYTVQANDIIIKDDKAYIAYNYAGEIYAGAIQIVDISDENNPEIIKEFKFNEIDVNALFLDGSTLYFGGSVNPEIFSDNRSFISKVDTDNPTVEEIKNNMVYLRSYATTSIAKYNNSLYVSVGALNGGIEILGTDLSKVDFIENSDIRDLAVYSQGVYALSGTYDNNETTGKIIDIINDSEIDIGNFYSPERKATVEIYGGENKLHYFKDESEVVHSENYMTFLGLAQEGFKIAEISGNASPNQIVYSKTLEQLTADKENDVQVSVNSVAYDGGLVFTALGEYGFKVIRVNGMSVDTDTGVAFYDEENFAETVGKHKIVSSIYGNTQPYSINQIAYRNSIQNNEEVNYLFAAAGEYGVNIYKLKHKEELEYKDLSSFEYNEKNLVNNNFYLHFKQSVPVNIVFLDGNNGMKTEFGYYTLNATGNEIENILDKTPVFSNTSKQGNGGTLTKGIYYNIDASNIDAGTNLLLYAIEDGFNNSDGSRFYSDGYFESNIKQSGFHYSYYLDEITKRMIIGIDPINHNGKINYGRLVLMIEFLGDESLTFNDIVEIKSN